MQRFIVLLRGINVSGKNKIKMEELRYALTNTGFEGVKTYIQSGNIVLEANQQSCDLVETTIEKLLREEYGYNVKVFAFKPKEFEEIIKKNPYASEQNRKVLYFTFISASVLEAQVEELREVKSGEDRFETINRLIYIFCPSGYGKTKYNNSFFEKKLKTEATTRNWATVHKLIEMSS